MRVLTESLTLTFEFDTEVEGMQLKGHLLSDPENEDNEVPS